MGRAFRVPDCLACLPGLHALRQVMRRDAARMRGTGPTVFAQAKHDVCVDDIVAGVLDAWSKATGNPLKN